MTHLDNPLHGAAIRSSGWLAAMALAPMVLAAAAILALTPRYPVKPKDRD